MNHVSPSVAETLERAEATVPVRIVDCGIHVNPRHGMEIAEFMPRNGWRAASASCSSPAVCWAPR